MAITKFVSRTPPERSGRIYLQDEFKRVEVSISSLILLLEALEVPIEVGAPDSGGTGFRVLRIPNGD